MLEHIKFDSCFANYWDEGWITRDADWREQLDNPEAIIVPKQYPADCLKYRIERFITHSGPYPFTVPAGSRYDDDDEDEWFEGDESFKSEPRLCQ